MSRPLVSDGWAGPRSLAGFLALLHRLLEADRQLGWDLRGATLQTPFPNALAWFWCGPSCPIPRFVLDTHLLDTDGKLGGDLLDRAGNLSDELCLRWEVLHRTSQLLAGDS